MKYLLIIFISFFGFTSCLVPPAQHGSFQEPVRNFTGKYKQFLEQGEVELISGFHYVGTKNLMGKYILRKFYPEKNLLTSMTEFDSKFKIKNGFSQKWNDDGELKTKGNYSGNKKTGKWIRYSDDRIVSESNYENGRQMGKSTSYHKNGNVSRINNYLNGRYHGKQIEYDSLNLVINEHVYNNGELIETITESEVIIGSKARFASCEEVLELKERTLCSQKLMLQYIYRNLKYPSSAKRYGIEGTSIVKFVVKKDGSISDVNCIQGVSDDIKEASINVIKSMPKWIPAQKDGELVDMLYTIPIKFKLGR